MSKLTLSKDPQHIDKKNWYYEDPGGIDIIHQVVVNGICKKTDSIKIPWIKLRQSLKRRDTKRKTGKENKMDRDGYPTQPELDTIKNWDLTKDSVGNFLDHLEETWNADYGAFKLTGKKVLKLALHTGGWSGNEDIIGALQESHFWLLYWERSDRGGHYYFKIKAIAKGGKRWSQNLEPHS